ncbi:MAG: peptidoglycan DD-metalloendopeptidase family protein [Acaryochloridaceae cyanobacterium RL_2_7]|nr:peptidoglycan DD-metalloendopeptidase family protein [Acaryochloridaceae cyanobacterium RL_2_7]
MIREIPQKVEFQSSLDVSGLGADLTLLRRTRSTVLLGCLIAVGSIGLFAPQQKAFAAASDSGIDISMSDNVKKAKNISLKHSMNAVSTVESAKRIRDELKQTRIKNINKSALADSGAVVHDVSKGETLASIAKQYEVPIDTLIQTNSLNNPNDIQAKESIVIPTAQSPTELGSAKSPVLPANRPDASLVIASVDDGAIVADKPLALAPKDKDYQERTDAERELDLSNVKVKLNAAERESVKSKVALNTDIASSSSGVVTPGLPGMGKVDRPGLDLIDIPVAVRGPVPKLPELELPALVSDNYLPNEWQGSGSMKFVWPAKGAFTSGYGWRWGRMHRGIDIAAPIGTPIMASAPGVVTYAQYNDGGYGNLVEVTHPDGSLTLYAHNNRILVKNGAFVSQGQQISEMGSTGRSTGPHLHFELHTAGRGAVDPVYLLGKS